MLIRKNEIQKLSSDIRRMIDGQKVDFRDHREGAWNLLKNDIYTLAYLKNEQVDSFQYERDAMSDTLANISHQLKTPLTSMMIMADLLENAPPDKQAEFITNLKIGLTQMDWFVSALLKMAKLDAGAIKFSKDNIASDELISLALSPLHILLDVKDQCIDIAGSTELYCDKHWTAEALGNVIKNASEYSPVGSRIHIESGMNPICRWISVTDGGEGIPRHKISGLFRRFEGSRSTKGYGIGLPLALAILRSQNGDIEVDNGGHGKGATFTFKFFK